MGIFEEQDVVQFSGPIVPKKDCQLRIDFAENVTWTVKAGVPGYEGKEYKALKLTCTITDEDIATEGEHIRPRLVIEHQLNLEKYPYLSKKTSQVEFMSRNGLYDLEEAFGFEPRFVDGQGQAVEPFITRTGRKVAPKLEGVKRVVNPDFAAAYFQADGTVKPDAWINKAVYADITVEESEQFGARNQIRRFRGTPVAV